MSKKLNDAELTKLAIEVKQNNNQRAFARIYEMTKGYVYGIVRGKIYNTDDADEVVQDVYLSLFKSIDSYDESRPFLTWFSRIINLRCIDKIRKIYAHRIEHALGDDAPVSDILSDMLDDEVNRAELHNLIEKLPEQMRNIIRLYYIDSKSTTEISELMNIKQDSVTSALSRGRNKLKLEILDYEEENEIKLHSSIWLAPIMKMFSEQPKMRMPASSSKVIFTNVAKAAGLSKSTGLMIGGVAVMGVSTGIKIAIVSTAIALTGCSIGIPVYVHNENEKTAQAMAAMSEAEYGNADGAIIVTEDTGTVIVGDFDPHESAANVNIAENEADVEALKEAEGIPDTEAPDLPDTPRDQLPQTDQDALDDPIVIPDITTPAPAQPTTPPPTTSQPNGGQLPPGGSGPKHSEEQGDAGDFKPSTGSYGNK